MKITTHKKENKVLPFKDINPEVAFTLLSKGGFYWKLKGIVHMDMDEAHPINALFFEEGHRSPTFTFVGQDTSCIPTTCTVSFGEVD